MVLHPKMRTPREEICRKYKVKPVLVTEEDRAVLLSLGIGSCAGCYFMDKKCLRIECYDEETGDSWCFIKSEETENDDNESS